MIFQDHYDSDQPLDSILATAETEELTRIQDGLNLDSGLASITRSRSCNQVTHVHVDRGDIEARLLTDASHEPRRWREFPGNNSQHCGLVAVDVAGFANRRRDHQMQLRETLYRLVARACEFSGFGWDQLHNEDRGDGVLVIVPNEIPTATLLQPLADHLEAELRRHNKTSEKSVQIRLRMAIHSGYVRRDERGVSGAAIVHLFRLLAASALKKALAGSNSDLAVIVSDYFYENVIQHGSGKDDPMAYRPIKVAVKETRARAWLHLSHQDSKGSSMLSSRSIHGETRNALDVTIEPHEPVPEHIPVGSANGVESGSVAKAEMLPFHWERR